MALSEELKLELEAWFNNHGVDMLVDRPAFLLAEEVDQLLDELAEPGGCNDEDENDG